MSSILLSSTSTTSLQLLSFMHHFVERRMQIIVLADLWLFTAYSSCRRSINLLLQPLFCYVKPVKEFKPWNMTAVPPPESYSAEPVKKKGPPPGMDMAIKWSNVYEDNGEDAPKAHTAKAQFLPPEEQLSDSGSSVSVETVVQFCLVSCHQNI